MIGNLVRCIRCGKSMIAEESKEHSCAPLIQATQRIKVDQFCVITNPQGRTEVVAVGLDGTLYTLEVLSSSNGSFQTIKNRQSDDDFPVPDGSVYIPFIY